MIQEDVLEAKCKRKVCREGARGEYVHINVCHPELTRHTTLTVITVGLGGHALPVLPLAWSVWSLGHE